MSEDHSQMANTLESNDSTSNLPPPGGGYMAPSSNDDDTANGNGPVFLIWVCACLKILLTNVY